jgi:hypothetical protein
MRVHHANSVAENRLDHQPQNKVRSVKQEASQKRLAFAVSYLVKLEILDGKFSHPNLTMLDFSVAQDSILVLRQGPNLESWSTTGADISLNIVILRAGLF